MANISHATGTLRLNGLWTQEALDLVNPVLEAWEFHGAYGLRVYGSISGDPFQDDLSVKFEGTGRWDFAGSLENFDDWTWDHIHNPPAGTGHPLSEAAYRALLEIMYEKGLTISLGYNDELEEGGTVGGSGRFASDGRQLLFARSICKETQEQDERIFRQKGGLVQYEGPGGDVVLDGSVTMIAPGAFSGRADITGIVLPKHLTYLGWDAFAGCTGLTNITIPEGVEEIESGAFKGCTSLTHVTLPASVRRVGPNAFTDTPWLDALGELAIVNGTLLRYRGTGKEVTVPEGVHTIGDSSFAESKTLKSVVLPNSVREIQPSAFEKCKALVSVTFSEGLKSIGNAAFRGCTRLQSAVLPESVRTIGWAAFCGCTKLANVTLPQRMEPFRKLMRDGFGNISFFSPDVIGCGAFQGCRSLTRIALPEGDHAGVNLWCFSGCSALEEVTLPKSLWRVCADGFKNCKSLKQLTLPEGVQYINKDAFSGCVSLTDLTIPASVQKMYKSSFAKCEHLTIHASAGSYAAGFARQNGIPFKPL